MRKNKGSTLLQGAGPYIAKLNRDPIWIKVRKVNVLIIYYKALGQLHKCKMKNKDKRAKRNYIESARALDPLKVRLKLKN